MDKRVHLFGIRHHGPGSAASLLHALNTLDPAVVLIEGPPEANNLIHFANYKGMTPPLALLIYDAENPAQSVFYPFAAYSPEWQAMRWALDHGKEVRFIDLPVGMSFALYEKYKQKATDKAAKEDESEDKNNQHGDENGDEAQNAELLTSPTISDDKREINDPLELLAKLAGYDDGESWWNALIEERGAASDVFPAITQAMSALRNEIGFSLERSPMAVEREQMREAHMRLEIAKTIKENNGEIAVICGAWHVPALAEKHAQSADRDCLKGLKPIKTAATWAPWSETRLATGSGYGAGVAAPGWYGHLWSKYKGSQNVDAAELASHWQAQVGRLLRDQGFSGATASVIEAARLALTLATLHGRSIPDIDDMRDASLAALCQGEAAAFHLIDKKLFIGEKIGSLDDSVPQLPLMEDLQRWQKKTRLKPEALDSDISVDLRSEAGLIKSTLLHRLNLIEVPWGQLTASSAGRGTFREQWRLRWQPELSVALAEAMVYGVTIEMASANAAIAKARASQAIGELAKIVEGCLLADLPQAAEIIIARLQEVAVVDSDIGSLMKAIPPLVSVLRYGTARRIPENELRKLVETLLNEIHVNLEMAVRNLNEDEASTLADIIADLDPAISQFDNKTILENWVFTLTKIISHDMTSPAIAGRVLRLLHERGALEQTVVATHFSRHLTPPIAPQDAGLFLESFLSGSPEILLQDTHLIALVNEWLLQIDESIFTELLPIIRRGFSSFDAIARRRLTALVITAAVQSPTPANFAQQGSNLSKDDNAASNVPEAFYAALPLLETILGLQKDTIARNNKGESQ